MTVQSIEDDIIAVQLLMQLTALLHSALKRTARINVRVNKHIWEYWHIHH